MRSAVKRVSLNRFMESSRGATRYFSDSQGKIFGEEERAAETIYIKVFPFAPFDPSISFAEVKEARWLRKFIDSCCFPWFTAFVLKHAKSHEVDAIRVWFGKLFSFGFMWLSIMSSIDDAWKSFFFLFDCVRCFRKWRGRDWRSWRRKLSKRRHRKRRRVQTR